MRKRKAYAVTRSLDGLPQLTPDAAGLDMGAEEIWGWVPAGRDPQPVRAFGTFTPDLHALAQWLTQCGVKTVARESTGVYWIPLYEVLDRIDALVPPGTRIDPKESFIPNPWLDEPTRRRRPR